MASQEVPLDTCRVGTGLPALCFLTPLRTLVVSWSTFLLFPRHQGQTPPRLGQVSVSAQAILLSCTPGLLLELL